MLWRNPDDTLDAQRYAGHVSRPVVGIIICVAIAVMVLVWVRGGDEPNYSPTATASCLRAENIPITLGRQGHSGRLLIVRRRGWEPLGLFFASSTKAAQDAAARQHSSVGTPVARNVVFNVGGTLSDMAPRVLACLRSG